MGIERRRDAPNQKFRAVADRKPVVDHRHGAVGDEALDPRPVDDRGSEVPAVQPGYPGQIDGKVAHDPLDDVGAEAIFPGEYVSLGGGEPVLGDAREIVADQGRRDFALAQTTVIPGYGYARRRREGRPSCQISRIERRPVTSMIGGSYGELSRSSR